MAFHTPAAGELAGCGSTAGNSEHPSHGVGIWRVPVVFEPLADSPRSQHPGGSRERVGVGGVDVGGQFVEELVVGAKEVGCAVEEHGDVALGDVIEQWEQLMSDPVATETWVDVGGVVDDREAELIAQSLSVGASKGEDRMAPTWPDCSEAGGPRTSDQGEEHGLCLVVCGVTGQRVGSESGPPSAARSRFEIGAVGEVDADRAECDAESCGGGPCNVGVDIGGLTETMVDMHRGDSTAGRNGEGDERRGVGATGESADDLGAFGRKGAPVEEAGGVGQREPALFGDRYRSVCWVERCLRPGCCLAVTDQR